MAKLKKKRNRKQERQRELYELQRKIVNEKVEIRRLVESKREKLTDAKTQERADDLADQIDALRFELKRLEARRDEVASRAKKLAGSIKRLSVKIKRKVARRRYMASPHFAYSEFDCHDGRKVPKDAYPSLRAWCHDVGEPARARFGAVHVLSGYRPADYNSAIGGAPNSIHIYDYAGREGKAVAVDWRADTGDARGWFDFTAGRADGRGYYPNSGFHHADNRNRIGWPDATWTG